MIELVELNFIPLFSNYRIKLEDSNIHHQPKIPLKHIVPVTETDTHTQTNIHYQHETRNVILS